MIDLPTLFDIRDSTAVITGGSGVLGRVMALAWGRREYVLPFLACMLRRRQRLSKQFKRRMVKQLGLHAMYSNVPILKAPALKS
jgi:short-subunit dehydrogenase